MAGRDCDDLLAVLDDFLDGEVTDERRESLRQHLEACPPCLQTADFQTQLRAVIARRCVEQVPEGLRERITTMIGTAAFEPPPAAE